MRRVDTFALLLVVLALLPAGCSRRADAGPRPDLAKGNEIRKTLEASPGGEAAPEEEASASSEPTGWATLSGTFLFDGVPTKPAPIVVTKDAEVCGKHPLFDESVDVGPGGGLENMAIWVRTPKVPVKPELKDQPGKQIELDNKNCRFEPHVLSLLTADTLVIKNSDPVGHNSKLEPNKNPAFNSIIESGKSTQVSLKQEEPKPIRVGCSIHPWMGGWIVLRSDPYVSVSDKDGHFTIANLPAGKELEFQLWQEKVEFPKQVEADGGVKVDGKGRFKLKLEPGEDKKLTFKVSLK